MFGKVGKLTSMLCVCYGVTAEVCYSGGADGRVYHWKDSTLCKTVQANKGPLYAISRVDKVSIWVMSSTASTFSGVGG